LLLFFSSFQEKWAGDEHDFGMKDETTLFGAFYGWDQARVALWSAYFWCNRTFCACIFAWDENKQIISLSYNADVDQVIFGSDFLEFEHDPVFHSTC